MWVYIQFDVSHSTRQIISRFFTFRLYFMHLEFESPAGQVQSWEIATAKMIATQQSQCDCRADLVDHIVTLLFWLLFFIINFVSRFSFLVVFNRMMNTCVSKYEHYFREMAWMLLNWKFWREHIYPAPSHIEHTENICHSFVSSLTTTVCK